MDKETEKRALKALENQKKQYQRQNSWINENYERQTVTLPKGTRDRIKATGAPSVNGYINKLVADDLTKKGV